MIHCFKNCKFVHKQGIRIFESIFLYRFYCKFLFGYLTFPAQVFNFPLANRNSAKLTTAYYFAKFVDILDILLTGGEILSN